MRKILLMNESLNIYLNFVSEVEKQNLWVDSTFTSHTIFIPYTNRGAWCTEFVRTYVTPRSI